MIITVLGNTDRTPIVYTLLRLISTYGETSLVTNDSKLLKLSDSKASGGYYLDTQINCVEEIDDYDIYVESMFYTNFLYDGLVPFFSDILIYCSSTMMSKKEIKALSKYNANHVIPLELYSDKNNFFDQDLKDRLAKFVKERNYDCVSEPLCAYLAHHISKMLGTSEAFIFETLTGHAPKKKGLFNVNDIINRFKRR